MKRFIFALLLIIGGYVYSPLFAQSDIELTPQQKEDIIVRMKDKLEDFLFRLQLMGEKTNPLEVRQKAYDQAIKLFIGNCEPYYVMNPITGASERKKAVQMETSSVNRSTTNCQPMKQYFKNLLNNRSYTNIKIEQADVIRIDNFRQVGPGKYEAIASFCQYFKGYSGDQIRYADKTYKTVKIYIDYTLNRGSSGDEAIFDIKLGDMKVLATERI